MASPSSSPIRGEHAVVIGGSVAGLLAARVTVDPHVALTVAEVLHLQRPTSALLQPRILAPVLQGVRRPRNHAEVSVEDDRSKT